MSSLMMLKFIKKIEIKMNIFQIVFTYKWFVLTFSKINNYSKCGLHTWKKLKINSVKISRPK